MKISYLFLLVILCIPTWVTAEYELSGWIFHESRILTGEGLFPDSEYYSKGEFVKSLSRLKLKLNSSNETGFKFFSEVFFNCNHLDSIQKKSNTVDLSQNDYDAITVNEIYVSAEVGNIEFKLGKMIVNWGRTDEINAIDVINPEDFSEFYTIPKVDRKIPIFLLSTSTYVNNFSIEGVFIPFFEPAKIPSKGPWALKELHFLRTLFENFPNQSFDEIDFNNEENEGDRHLDNSELAIRLKWFFKAFDFGIVYFNGYNDIPAIGFHFDTIGQPLVDIYYSRFNGYGFDFSSSIADFCMRGEFIYQDSIVYSTQTTPYTVEVSKSPNGIAIIGIDKLINDSYYVNIQYILNLILEHKDAMIDKEIENVIMGKLQRKFYHDNFEIEFKFSHGLDENGGMNAISSKYLFTDNFHMEIGFLILYGSNDYEFGQFAGNDCIYIKSNYFF